MTQLVVGVDVGGTFTDLILMDRDGGRLAVAKVPTTPENQADGVLSAIGETGIDPSQVTVIVHGTTATTNALLERKLPKVGLITTAGFRDVLELGRRTRPQAYGMFGKFQPLIPREWRLEVPERMDADGAVVTPLDEEAVKAAARQLRRQKVESVVIHFLHSYANPAHERRAAEIVRDVWRNDHVTVGSDILSEYREYERGTTAAVNGAVRPVLTNYLSRLEGELQARGYSRDLLVMQGNGGTVSTKAIVESAVNTVMSGPASGVMAAAYTGRAAGKTNLITYDMGGTSTDVGLIRDGVPQVSSELELEYGIPIHVPMVDVHTIGAGGGSIARVTDAGLLQVGPESAGARPGPICYGRGGEAVTITDANLVLGRLNPEALLSVAGAASLDDVKMAITEQIGGKLGLDADSAAAAIVQIANLKMAEAIRMVSLARGHDPRDFALFAFGGAGPLHASALAKELGIPTVLVPARPGITNALGCIVADLRHDYVRTINTPLRDLEAEAVHAVLADQISEGRAMIEREGVPVEEITTLCEADMQFLGQSHILTVTLPKPDVDIETLQALFEEAYWQRFAVRLPEIRPVLVNLHTAVIGRRQGVDPALLAPAAERAASLAEAQTGMRRVRFGDTWHETPIYRRPKLPTEAEITGPAILEQMDTTVVVEPGDRANLDTVGNVCIWVSPTDKGDAA